MDTLVIDDDMAIQNRKSLKNIDCCAQAVHPTEAKYPQQTTMWKDIDRELYVLHLNKNKDYSPANIVVVGLPGIIVRMWDKMSRIFNLFGLSFPSLTKEIEDTKKECINFINDNEIPEEQRKHFIDFLTKKFDELHNHAIIDWSKFKEQLPENEPLEDAFKDIRNYAQIALIFRNKKWGK